MFQIQNKFKWNYIIILIIELVICIILPCLHYIIQFRRIDYKVFNSIIKFISLFSFYKFTIMGYPFLYYITYKIASSIKQRKLKTIEISFSNLIIYLFTSCVFFVLFPFSRWFIYGNIKNIYQNFFYYSLLSGFIAPFIFEVFLRCFNFKKYNQ